MPPEMGPGAKATPSGSSSVSRRRGELIRIATSLKLLYLAGFCVIDIVQRGSLAVTGP